MTQHTSQSRPLHRHEIDMHTKEPRWDQTGKRGGEVSATIAIVHHFAELMSEK